MKHIRLDVVKNRFYVKVLFTLGLLFFAGIYSLYSTKGNTHPHVEQGVLDLSNWSLEEQGIIELAGQWGFVEGITNAQPPEHFEQFATVPGDMPIAQNQGAGTYYVKIIFPTDEKRALAVDVEGVRMSNAFFVNGERIHLEGQPANDVKAYEARNIPYMAPFTTTGREVMISFQVANFDYYKTGIHLPIFFGTIDQINKRQLVQIVFEASIFMMTFVVAFIFLVIYFSFDKQKEGLILGGYFIVLAILMATTNHKIYLQMFPQSPFLLFVKIRDFAMYSSIPLLIWYSKRLFPNSKKGWLPLYVIAALYSLYCVAIVVVPYRMLGGSGDAILLPLFIVIYILMPVMLLNKYRKNEVSIVNKKELEYFILLVISEIGIITSSLMYYSSLISYLIVFIISGVLASLYTILMFIEKFKKTYLSMEHYATKLEHENRMKDEFLSRTSHELKTPLHGIINLAQLSIDHKSNDERTIIEKNNLLIKATARRMAIIVNDLVDFSLIRENKFRLEIREIDLLYCVQSVVEVMAYPAMEKNIKLQMNVADEARYAVADEARIIQVIYNLVQNSLQHTKSGAITISTKLVHQKIQLSVLDTGGGIPLVERETIFQAYEQGSNRQNNGGLGLGLAISKQLISQMGGTLSLDWSEVGKGSKFSIVIDKATTSQQQSNQFSIEGMIEDVVRYPSTKAQVTILIVDDEPLNRRVLREILKYQNATILEAENDKQVYELLAANVQPDIILLDVLLENTTGYEICKKVRESYSLIELPILFITANHALRHSNQAFLVGGNDFLTKPFEAEEVRARVDTLLRMKKLAKQATENELAFLQSQIKPHFLFNTLSAIIAYTYEDPEKTRTLLESLSTYLRTVFQTSKQTEWISLRTELELTEAFVAIQQQRYEERLHISFDIDEQLLQYFTPPLLLQPLVENAIAHGVLKRSKGGYITIVIEEKGDGIQITVQDNGVGMSAEKIAAIFAENTSHLGVGLANVQKRMLRLTKQPLTIDSSENEGTMIRYWLPLISSQE